MSAVRGDALHLPLPDESVDLIITSPPYFALRSYRDEGEHYGGQIGSEETPKAFLEALWTATREMVRVLKPTGSIFVNLGDKYAGSRMDGSSGNDSLRNSQSYIEGRAQGQGQVKSSGGIRPKSLMGLPWRYAIGCIDDLGLILRAEIVWSKPNGLPESVTDRVRRSHENWFHFVREPRYFSAVDEVRESHTQSSLDRFDRPFKAAPEQVSGPRWTTETVTPNPLGKLPGSVWTIPSEPLKVPAHLGIDHFAAFPQEWPRRLILGWSPSGICVECGEGRRPVVFRKNVEWQTQQRPGLSIDTGRGGEMVTRPSREDGIPHKVAVTIADYACACPETSADTQPSVVLDPFGGTGTVALVARALGRIGISVDLSMDYCRLAKWRISQPANKVLSRTWHERQGAFL